MAKACAFPSSGYQLTNFSKGSLFSHIAILSWLSFNFNFDLTPSRVCGPAAEFDSTVSIISASKVRSTRRIMSRNEWTDVPEAEPIEEVGEVDETASGVIGAWAKVRSRCFLLSVCEGWKRAYDLRVSSARREILLISLYVP